MTRAEFPEEPRERRAWRTDAEWARLRERIDGTESTPAPRRRWRRRPLILAAASVAIVAAGVDVSRRVGRTSGDAPPREVATAAGERITIRLADSSRVTLGPSTRIRYTAGDTLRTIELTGLAEFDVVHDGRRPFVVRALNTITRDVGTAFVVRAYPGDPAVSVAVSDGEVEIAVTVRNESTALLAGEAVLVDSAGRVHRETHARFVAATAWVAGRIVFDDMPLRAIALEVSRWFDVDMRVPDSAFARRRVSAVYNQPSLDGVLEAVTAITGARVERTGRAIVLHPGRR